MGGRVCVGVPYVLLIALRDVVECNWRMGMGKQEIITVLVEHKSELERYGVKSLALFGSFARGEERPDSDIDILVEFSRPVGLFEFIRLKDYLAGILSRRVDLVTTDALKPRFKDRILKEALHAA
jgi:predicted nucleotidyltransferase